VRPDVTVLDDRDLLDLGLASVADVVEANLGRRPVLEAVREPTGLQPLWRVIGLRATGTEPTAPGMAGTARAAPLSAPAQAMPGGG